MECLNDFVCEVEPSVPDAAGFCVDPSPPPPPPPPGGEELPEGSPCGGEIFPEIPCADGLVCTELEGLPFGICLPPE